MSTIKNSKRVGRIVVVDDDAEMCAMLEDALKSWGHDVHVFRGAVEALGALGQGGSLGLDKAGREVDLVLSDIRMPRMDGLEFVERLKAMRPEIPVILATAFGSIETAIEATRRGAYHYLVKPFKLAELQLQVDRGLEKGALDRENRTLRKEARKDWALGDQVLGKSSAMQNVFELVRKVAPALSTVLITGESGTGKEVVARAIHQLGPRKDSPFIAINCSAIPETLLESELFGHAKGAFTGAHAAKKGLFEEADGGILFLDEIGDLPPLLQSKLLRVLQEKEIRPVGDNKSKSVDVRVLAATHKDLRAMVKEGHFREDLYFRLAVLPILIPPLRERVEDIPILAEHFLKKAIALNGSSVRGFTPSGLSRLSSYHWSGNVRELENVIERTVVLSSNQWISAEDLPLEAGEKPDALLGWASDKLPTLEELERRYVQIVLDRVGGVKERAAQILGVNRRTLLRWEKRE